MLAPPRVSAYELAARRFEVSGYVSPWRSIARPAQLLPPLAVAWLIWLFMAGRGAGKTRSAAEAVAELMRRYPGCRVALVAQTIGDARDTMVEGESGLLAALDPSELRGGTIDAAWNRSLGELYLANGSMAKTYSSEKPRKLRGPQHHFCFPAGTLVRTPGGEQSIETLRAGDLVMTRSGARPVTVATSRIAAVATVHHERGSLTGTPDHPVWVDGAGWIPLGDLAAGDSLITWTDENGRSIAADTGTDTSRAGSSGGTGKSGSRPTGRSLAASRSTTTTKSQGTTTYPTWSRSPLSSTASSMLRLAPRAPAGNADSPSSTAAVGDRRGTASPASPGSASVDVVSLTSPASTVAPGSSPVPAGGSVVSGVSTSGLVTRVYNLTVADDPEYFADGVLVHNCWADELATFTDAHKDAGDVDTTWSNLMLGLRLPTRAGWPADYSPRVIVTTTPRRVALLKVPPVVAEAEPHRAGLTQMPRSTVVITHGTTDENLENLADAFRVAVVDPLRGTRLGRQELNAELLEDVEGALLQQAWIDRARIHPDDLPVLAARVTAVDPATTTGDGSDETGIVTVGVDQAGEGYVLADDSGKHSPEEWSAATWTAVIDHGCDAVVVEDNQGGDMVETVLKVAWLELARDLRARGSTIRGMPPIVRVTPSGKGQGKWIRAQPVARLYENAPGRIHHVGGGLDLLEYQGTTWKDEAGEDSPDRVDALVHGLSWLLWPGRRKKPRGAQAPQHAPGRWTAGGRR